MHLHRLIAFFLLGLITTGTLVAVSTTEPTSNNAAPPLPGVELAETLATATGIAITPMLGVSAVPGEWGEWCG